MRPTMLGPGEPGWPAAPPEGVHLCQLCRSLAAASAAMSRIEATARQYTPADLEACLEVFDTNVPRFFRAEERHGFATFLQNRPGPYYVVVDAFGSVLGCGGYAVRLGAGVADLCWGMVRRDRHGLGLGRMLAQLRVNEIRRESGVAAIALNTSQHTTAFYEALGFRTTRVERDGYAPGLDRHEMVLDLVAARGGTGQ